MIQRKDSIKTDQQPLLKLLTGSCLSLSFGGFNGGEIETET